jgi:hypothetical protein
MVRAPKTVHEPNNLQCKATAVTIVVCADSPSSLSHDNPRAVLSDGHDKLTTPAIPMSKQRNKDLPSDTLHLIDAASAHNPAHVQAQKSFLKTHHKGEKVGPKTSAEGMLRAMERRKLLIGVGIDRGGCTLVNEERRKTFVQNPGIRGVVPADF